MKKISFIVVGILSIQSLHAQNISYSAEAGINFSGAYAVEDGQVIKGGTLPGFQLGVSAKKTFKQNISFQPALLFVYGGTTRNLGDGNAKYHVSLFRLPLDVVYRTKSKFSIGAGPFLGYALSGKINFPAGFPGPKSEKIIFGNNPDEDDSRRLDAGVEMMAIYSIEPALSLKAVLDWGMINPALKPLRVNTRCVGIMFNYLLK